MSTLQHRRNKRNRNRAIRGQETTRTSPGHGLPAYAHALIEEAMYTRLKLELIEKIGAPSNYVHVQFSPKT